MPRKKKKRKKSDFPNEWKFYKNLEPDQFETPTYKDFIEERVHYWELLPGVQLVTRAQHLRTGKIRERIFTTTSEIRKFMSQIQKSGEPYHVFCYDNTHSFTAIFPTDD
jgi:hypothetical protein